MVEYVSQAMRAAAKESTVLLYALSTDLFLEMMTSDADGVFTLDDGRILHQGFLLRAVERRRHNEATALYRLFDGLQL